MKTLIGLKFIIIISCLMIVAPARASGIIFHWQLFVVNSDFELDHPNNKNIIINDLPAIALSMPDSVESRETFFLFPDQNNDSTPNSSKKATQSKVKIMFGGNTFMPAKDEAYANSDDQQVSKIINTMTSLFYEDSKFESLETLGKTIEPQINFYFTF